MPRFRLVEAGPVAGAVWSLAAAAGIELTAFRHIRKAGNDALDGVQAVLQLVDFDRAFHQPLGIGVEGVAEEGKHVGHFDNLTGVHNDDTVRDLGNDAQVMGDEDDGGVDFPHQLFHQVQNLRLNGDIQSGGGLVGHQ